MWQPRLRDQLSLPNLPHRLIKNNQANTPGPLCGRVGSGRNASCVRTAGRHCPSTLTHMCAMCWVPSEHFPDEDSNTQRVTDMPKACNKHVGLTRCLVLPHHPELLGAPVSEGSDSCLSLPAEKMARPKEQELSQKAKSSSSLSHARYPRYDFPGKHLWLKQPSTRHFCLVPQKRCESVRLGPIQTPVGKMG